MLPLTFIALLRSGITGASDLTKYVVGLSRSQIFTLTADIGYLICSVLCFACWFRDLELELFPVDDPTQAAAAGAPADDAAVKRPLLARAPSAMQLLRQVSMQISAESCDQTTAADEPANDARKSTSRMSSVASVAMPAMHAEHASSTVVGVPSDQSHDAIISRCTAVGDADVEHAIRSLVVHVSDKAPSFSMFMVPSRVSSTGNE